MSANSHGSKSAGHPRGGGTRKLGATRTPRGARTGDPQDYLPTGQDGPADPAIMR